MGRWGPSSAVGAARGAQGLGRLLEADGLEASLDGLKDKTGERLLAVSDRV